MAELAKQRLPSSKSLPQEEKKGLRQEDREEKEEEEDEK